MNEAQKVASQQMIELFNSEIKDNNYTSASVAVCRYIAYTKDFIDADLNTLIKSIESFRAIVSTTFDYLNPIGMAFLSILLIKLKEHLTKEELVIFKQLFDNYRFK